MRKTLTNVSPPRFPPWRVVSPAPHLFLNAGHETLTCCHYLLTGHKLRNLPTSTYDPWACASRSGKHACRHCPGKKAAPPLPQLPRPTRRHPRQQGSAPRPEITAGVLPEAEAGFPRAQSGGPGGPSPEQTPTPAPVRDHPCSAASTGHSPASRDPRLPCQQMHDCRGSRPAPSSLTLARKTPGFSRAPGPPRGIIAPARGGVGAQVARLLCLERAHYTSPGVAIFVRIWDLNSRVQILGLLAVSSAEIRPPPPRLWPVPQSLPARSRGWILCWPCTRRPITNQMSGQMGTYVPGPTAPSPSVWSRWPMAESSGFVR